MNSFDYTGKTALVTGASSGIGREFARQLAARGVGLILVARSEATLQALAAELHKTHGVSLTVIVQDLTLPEAITHIVERLEALRLYPDILINSARGLPPTGDLKSYLWRASVKRSTSTASPRGTRARPAARHAA